MLDNAFQFLVCGFLMGIIYDFFRFLRFVFRNKAAVFLLDFFFFVLYSLLFFILLLGYNNGTVRAIYFTAYFLGLVVYILTVFRLTARFQSTIAGFIRKILKKIARFIKKLLQLPKHLYYNVVVLSKKPLRKFKGARKGKKKKSGGKNERNSDPHG